LLERDSALDAIEACLDGVQRDHGCAVMFEAHAGMGKTRLHEAALDRARELELRVLRAAGTELERSVAFGVARQLLGSQLGSLPRSERALLLAGAPAAVQELAGLRSVAATPAIEDDLALAHGLFTVLAAAEDGRPALIAIDDLHWSDTASLAFVLYLLRRLDELPAAVVLSQRPGFGGESAGLLHRIAAHPRVDVQRLAPLGIGAVEAMVRRARGSAAPALIDACAQVTAGNPFYLRELLHALDEDAGLDDEQLAGRARSLAPDAVARTLRVRIGRLGPPAGALARSIAILGDDVPLRHAAALAGMTLDEAAAVADGLAAVEILLAREPLRFVHPLVRQTVELDIPASERATRHLDAARLLYADGDKSERLAAHLLLGRAEANEWVVQQLRTAAAAAHRRGAPQSTVRYLERALEEPPAAEVRAEVLAELGSAEAAAGIATAPQRLAEAGAAATDLRRRAELALREGQALYSQGLHEPAARTFERALAELDQAPDEADLIELRHELQTGFVATASIAAPLRERAAQRSAQLLEGAAEGAGWAGGPASHGQRLLLAQAAIQASFAGASADEVAALAQRAWDDGRLLEREPRDEVAWTLVTAALTLSGELERSIAVADVVLDDARRRASPLAFASASNARAMPRLWQGAVIDAIADLELARDARRYGWRQFTRAAAASYCLCMIELGELDRAEQALFEDAPLDQARDLEDARRMQALAELRLAQGRPREAYEIARTTGRTFEPSIKAFGFCPWRVTAAAAAVALGDRGTALELAREARTIAEQTGVLHARVRALRVHGLCEQGERQLELLRWAVELEADGRPRLETIRALVELGSALRRANQRAAARDPLQHAADMAKRGGAKALYERARTELAATGARPRRELILEGAGSLTPSEQRIANLAAEGHSNPEIARRLFVTPKTVEYHLRNVYRKLDIKGRQQLATALQQP
jgi:DNA-binding CsgD family transcriptional regulator